MPIITPAYPEQNSTYNVTHSTRIIICNAFQRAHRIMQEMLAGQATWNKLFQSPPFWNVYRHFLVVIAVSRNKKDHSEWVGLVESKIRRLIRKFYLIVFEFAIIQSSSELQRLNHFLKSLNIKSESNDPFFLKAHDKNFQIKIK